MATRNRDILDYFPGEPWSVQLPVLKRIQEVWDATDVFVLRLPVASGKSKVAECILRWAMGTGRVPSGVVVANNRLLVDQYLAGGKGWAALKAADSYWCSAHDKRCMDRRVQTDKYCLESGNFYHPRSCQFVRDLRTARGRNRLVVNQHIYVAHKLYRPLVVVDECHTAERLVQEMGSVTLWRSEYGWRRPLYSSGDVSEWLASLGATTDPKLEALDDLLTGRGVPRYTIATGVEELRGRETEFIRLSPLDISDRSGILFPPSVGKLVLMSATVSDSDVAALGLGRRRVCTIEADSPIDPDRRPIEFTPVAPMDFRRRSESLPAIAEHIRSRVLPEFAGVRGVIHCPYDMQDELRRLLDSPRLVWADRAARNQVVGDFVRGAYLAGSVLVGSGLAEGLDLRDDLARFQLILTMPRKSIADPGVLWLAENQPERYEWLTIREFAQTVGRVCRHPEDWGVTRVLDSTADRELRSRQLPKWAAEAIVRF